MPAVKNILKHVEAVVAGKRRRCYRVRGHVIQKGETCLEVRDGPQAQTTYCAACAIDILARADQSLAGLSARFNEATGDSVGRLQRVRVGHPGVPERSSPYRGGQPS